MLFSVLKCTVPITKRQARSVSNRNVQMHDRKQRYNLVSTTMDQIRDNQVPDNVDYSQQCYHQTYLEGWNARLMTYLWTPAQLISDNNWKTTTIEIISGSRWSPRSTEIVIRKQNHHRNRMSKK